MEIRLLKNILEIPRECDKLRSWKRIFIGNLRVGVGKNRETNYFVAFCPKIELATQGKTINEAEYNMKQMIYSALESYQNEPDAKFIFVPQFSILAGTVFKYLIKNSGLSEKEFKKYLRAIRKK